MAIVLSQHNDLVNNEEGKQSETPEYSDNSDLVARHCCQSTKPNALTENHANSKAKITQESKPKDSGAVKVVPLSPEEFFQISRLKQKAIVPKVGSAMDVGDLQLKKGSRNKTMTTSVVVMNSSDDVSSLAYKLSNVTISSPGTQKDEGTLCSRGPVKTDASRFNQTAAARSPYSRANKEDHVASDECGTNASIKSEINHIMENSTQLPDDLTDFILQYSGEYSDGSRASDDERSTNASSPASDASPKCMSLSSDSAASPCVDSGSVTPSTGSSSPTTVRSCSRDRVVPVSLPEKIAIQLQEAAPLRPIRRTCPSPGYRKTTTARDRLKSMIAQREFHLGWVWAAKCWQAAPNALCFTRDADGDSFLHRVVFHKDLAKIYGLVEHIMKEETNWCEKPFDFPNKINETPLFVAVQRRLEEVAAYLLECGANPNIRLHTVPYDSPLHYAASRGMSDIVAVLCAAADIHIDAFNGLGLTPLLCAVRYHGVIEEESQCLVNNKPVIRALMKAGADAMVAESAPGAKTVVHYAVERLDPDLVEIFRHSMEAESLKQLVNTPSSCGITPLQLLGQMVQASSSMVAALSNQPKMSSFPHIQLRAEEHDEMRRKMFFTLIDCGAVPFGQNDAAL